MSIRRSDWKRFVRWPSWARRRPPKLRWRAHRLAPWTDFWIMPCGWPRDLQSQWLPRPTGGANEHRRQRGAADVLVAGRRIARSGWPLVGPVALRQVASRPPAERFASGRRVLGGPSELRILFDMALDSGVARHFDPRAARCVVQRGSDSPCGAGWRLARDCQLRGSAGRSATAGGHRGRGALASGARARRVE